MIVGMALKKVFEGKTIKVGTDDVSVQFHFGDQKEFNLWISEKMKSGAQKYPLIWYVIQPHERLLNGKIKINDGQLILFQGNDKTQQKNDTRYDNTYFNYLEPTYEMVNDVLKANPYITLLHQGKPIPDYDEPNYGVDNSNFNDFTSTNVKGEKSIGIVIVDAKILRLKMEITPQCILI